MADIPLQGTPGLFDPRNPTLLPNFDVPTVAGDTLGLSSPAAFLAANPRADATATATIGGTITTDDEVTLVVTNPIFGQPRFGSLSPAEISHTYTAISSDTTATVAEGLADLFNDDPVAQAAGLRADVGGTDGNVITFSHSGPIGNFSTLVKLFSPDLITIGGTATATDTLNVLFSGPSPNLAPAIAWATIGGTVTPTDTVALTFTNTDIADFPVTVTYTVVSGDTLATIAAGLAALVNADATLDANHLTASSTGATVAVEHLGVVGNDTVLSDTPGSTETVALEPLSGDLSGGVGYPGPVLVTVATTGGESTTDMATAVAAAITAQAELASEGITATPSTNTVTLVVPAAAEPITPAVWVNPATQTATITGAVAADDVLNIVIHNASLPGGAVTVSHTALLGETTMTLATNLAAAVNANAALIAAGITATHATNVVTLHWPALIGAMTFSESVSPGSETITLSGAATETIAIASSASETVTLDPTSGKLSGGDGPIIPTGNFTWSPGSGSTNSFLYGSPRIVGYDQVKQMVAQGMPIA